MDLRASFGLSLCQQIFLSRLCGAQTILPMGPTGLHVPQAPVTFGLFMASKLIYSCAYTSQVLLNTILSLVESLAFSDSASPFSDCRPSALAR